MDRAYLRSVILLLPMLVACEPKPPDTDTEDSDPVPELELTRSVRVTLDGAPVSGAVVMQGGAQLHVLTDEEGLATLTLSLDVPGELIVIASHADARVKSVNVGRVEPGELGIALTRFDTDDNLDYVFRDPGEPGRSDTTNQCGHCHVTITEGWAASQHRRSASNPRVHDLYSAESHVFTSQDACLDAAGQWRVGPVPSGGESERCYLGNGVLLDLDRDCDAAPCAETSANNGACAACHAPGIDGAIGGRGLLEARDLAFDNGVHCDVCHKVESVDLDSADPGVSGRLRIHRPTELFSGPGATWLPIYFGPSHDSPNIFMGSVQRPHYQNGQICAGCHEYEQAVELPGATIDDERWPQGVLPIHSTWSEWQQSSFSPDVPCNACHMPPAPSALNSADLQLFGGQSEAGVTGGFVRPPGSVRHHTWVGPSLPDSGMLQLSAALDVDKVVSDGALTVRVTTTNVGAGHRIPTGEPSRALILRVDAACDGAALDAVGGDLVPLSVGVVGQKSPDQDLAVWPGAQVGDRVLALRDDGPRDYDGFGPFGDGRFTAAQKGMRRWSPLASATVVALGAGDSVTLDRALDVEGADIVVVSRDNAAGESPQPMAGLPGFAFSRVLVGPDGQLMAPHHRAVDVVSDNRLAPHEAYVTTHTFKTPCESPTVKATLSYRRQPAWLVDERGWDLRDLVVQQVIQ